MRVGTGWSVGAWSRAVVVCVARVSTGSVLVCAGVSVGSVMCA